MMLSPHNPLLQTRKHSDQTSAVWEISASCDKGDQIEDPPETRVHHNTVVSQYLSIADCLA